MHERFERANAPPHCVVSRLGIRLARWVLQVKALDRSPDDTAAADPIVELDSGDYRHYPYDHKGEITAESDDPSILALIPESDFNSPDDRRSHIADIVVEMRRSIHRQSVQPYEVAERDEIDFEKLEAKLSSSSTPQVPTLSTEEFAALEKEFLN